MLQAVGSPRENHEPTRTTVNRPWLIFILLALVAFTTGHQQCSYEVRQLIIDTIRFLAFFFTSFVWDELLLTTLHTNINKLNEKFWTKQINNKLVLDKLLIPFSLNSFRYHGKKTSS